MYVPNRVYVTSTALMYSASNVHALFFGIHIVIMTFASVVKHNQSIDNSQLCIRSNHIVYSNSIIVTQFGHVQIECTLPQR